MILRITKWSGRLGNNLMQLRNCILVALYYNYNITFPKHLFLTDNKVIINKDTEKKFYVDQEGSNFFYSRKIKKFDKECFVSNIEKMREIMENLFTIDYKNLPKTDLVIHIRGGDIFSNNAHPSYIPPPLDFYKKIINKDKYENIIIVSDDNKNPCIKELIKLYPIIEFKLQRLEEDIKMILSAKNLVSSVGTFIPSLLFVTRNTETLYYPSYSIQVQEISHLKPCNLISLNFDKYREKYKIWKNSEQNRKNLINYNNSNS